MLGWCSPQSSVPRQTVGHHARAAMYEMGLTAACEGCRGEVPRLCLDIPPTGVCSFLIYPPAGAQWVPRPGGLLGGFPNPAKLICMGFAKNRLASSHTRRWRGRSPRAWESARGHAAAVQRRPGRWASSPSGLPYTSRAAYPTPTLHRAPRRPPCTSQPTYPTPPNRPALHPPPALRLPTDLPYTSQAAYPTPSPPDRPTLHPFLFPLL